MLQFAQVTQLITRESSDWAVLYTKDNDSANAVGVLGATSWTKDSGWYGYGPIYYRVAYSVRKLDPVVSGRATLKSPSGDERSRHFTLMLVSLLALYAVAFLVSYQVGRSPVEWVVGTLALATALLSNPIWSRFVFRAHPDILLGFLVAVATWLTVRAGASDDPVKSAAFWSAAFVWGLSGATKLSVLTFLPGLLPVLALFLIPPLSVGRLMTIVAFYLVALASYFAVGLPQTLKIGPVIEFFKNYPAHTYAATWASVTGWSVEFWRQALLPSAVIVLLSLGFGAAAARGREERRERLWPLFLIPAVPLLLYLRVGLLMSWEHYLFPVVTCFLVLFSRAVVRLVQRFRLGETALAAPLSRSVLLVCVSSVVFFFSAVPDAVVDVYEDRNKCRQDYEQVKEELRNVMKDGRRLLVDPYVPVDPLLAQNFSIKWGHELKDLQGASTVFATNRTYYAQFLPEAPSAYVLLDHKTDWRELRDFYRVLEKGEPFFNLKKEKWTLRRRTPCGLEVWTRE